MLKVSDPFQPHEAPNGTFLDPIQVHRRGSLAYKHKREQCLPTKNTQFSRESPLKSKSIRSKKTACAVRLVGFVGPPQGAQATPGVRLRLPPAPRVLLRGPPARPLPWPPAAHTAGWSLRMPASVAGPAASAPPKCGASSGGSLRRGAPTTFRALPRRLSAANPSRGWRPRAAASATSGRRKTGGPEHTTTHRPPPMPSGTVFRLLPERVGVKAGKPAS